MKKMSAEQRMWVLFLLISAVPSYGYIDPGIGAFLWQGFIAVGLGVVFHVLRFLGVMKKKKTEIDATGKESHGSDPDQIKNAA